MVNGRVPLLIEIKNEGEAGEMERLVYEELKNYKGQCDHFIVDTFDLEFSQGGGVSAYDH